VVAHQHVFLVAEMRVVAVLDPLLLHEFKLPGDVCVERHKNNAAFFLVGGSFALCGETSIGKTSPGDAATIDELAVEAEGISWMDASNMRADGTARAFGVGAEGEVGAAVGVLCDRRIRSVGGDFDGGSVSPAADKLCG